MWWLLLALAGCDVLFRVDDVSPRDGGASMSGADATLGARVVFLTTGTYTGFAFVGLDGADAQCQAEANKDPRKTPGRYVAWLSSTTMSAVERMNQFGGPFVLPDATHTVLAGNWPALTSTDSTPLAHAIDVGPDGATIASSGCDVWTNTTSLAISTSNSLSQDCFEWSSEMGTAWVGSANATDAKWTEDDTCLTRDCQSLLHLYCIQQ